MYFGHAQAIRLKKLGPDHVDVAIVYNNSGSVQRKLGNLEQAKEFFDRALAIYLKRLGPEHSLVSTVQRNLAKVQQLESANRFPTHGRK